jgi:hypothetical protein
MVDELCARIILFESNQVRKEKMLKNLLHHEVNVLKDGSFVKIPPTGIVARCTVDNLPCEDLEGFNLVETSLGEITGLPEPEDGVTYIVSRVVKEASDRDDLVCVGELIRDHNGKVIGAKGFSV